MIETEDKTNLRNLGRASADDDLSVLPAQKAEQREADWISLASVLLRSKREILLFTVAAVLVAAVVSFLIPSKYTGTAVILPPQQSDSAINSMMGGLGAIAGLNSKDLGLKNPADLFVEMLKCRTIADRLIDRFDLRRVYRVKRYQDARKELASRSKIDAGDEGLISISVADRDPNRAAQLANAYVEELHALDANLAIGEAAQRRLFYEQKMDAERKALAQAGLALRRAEEKSGFIQPEAQGKATIETVADMRAKIAVEEGQLQSMRTYATENNPDLKRAEQQVRGMRAQLAGLEQSEKRGNGALNFSTRQMPEAQLEASLRANELKYHEALYEFLGKQLEAARIDEAKGAVVIQVVDNAVTPEKRSSPRRLLIIAATGGIGFAVACLWALLAEALRRKQEDPQERKRLMQLRQSLKFSSWTHEL